MPHRWVASAYPLGARERGSRQLQAAEMTLAIGSLPPRRCDPRPVARVEDCHPAQWADVASNLLAYSVIAPERSGDDGASSRRRRLS